MRIACWIPKATAKYSEYVILPAFLRQQQLRECASIYVSTYSTARHGMARYGMVRYGAVQYSTVQRSTVQYTTVQYNTVH